MSERLQHLASIGLLIAGIACIVFAMTGCGGGGGGGGSAASANQAPKPTGLTGFTVIGTLSRSAPVTVAGQVDEDGADDAAFAIGLALDGGVDGAVPAIAGAGSRDAELRYGDGLLENVQLITITAHD